MSKKKPIDDGPSPLSAILQRVLAPKVAVEPMGAKPLKAKAGAKAAASRPPLVGEMGLRQLKEAGIRGVSIGPKLSFGIPTAERAARVYVQRKVSQGQLSPANLVPTRLQLDGVDLPTDVVEIGDIRPLPIGPGHWPFNRGSDGIAPQFGSGFWPFQELGGVAPQFGPGLWPVLAAIISMFGGGLWPFGGGGSSGPVSPFATTDSNVLKLIALLRSGIRPLTCGLSIGPGGADHPWSGTLGCFLQDDQGSRYILSNNHVLAGSNPLGDPAEFVPVGHPITQPSVPDRTPPAFGPALAHFAHEKLPVASLSAFVPLQGGGAANRVDAAIARLNDNTEATNAVFGLSDASNPTQFQPLLPPLQPGSIDLNYVTVGKVGRTTGLTIGTITDTRADVWIPYGNRDDQWALFVDQMIVVPVGANTTFSAPGDSGSAVFTWKDRRMCGLLFAGSDKATIVSPIDAVLAGILERLKPDGINSIQVMAEMTA